MRDARRAAVVALGILAGAATMAGAPARAQGGSGAGSPLRSDVAIGLCGSELVMAMAGAPQDLPCPDGWRCRRRRLPSKDTVAPIDVDLSRTGTKLAVAYADDSHQVFDLTVPGSLRSVVTHRVPGERYVLAGRAGQIVVTDEKQALVGESSFPRGTEVAAGVAEDLSRACPGTPVRWRMYQPEVELALYAPVLEFAPGETVFPTQTSFWPAERFKGISERVALEEYANLSAPDKRNGASIYARARAYDRSWLLEYWTYYPLDVGHVQGHPHDTEHVFIEVDRLGGGVIGILAAAHASVTPNNLYSALVPGAEPATLPIFVLVEKGKHALAPDVNHDGAFTPGLDVNVFSETSHLWGIRDAVGQSDAHMLSYEASMTLDRRPADAWAVRSFFEYFDRARFPQLDPAYTLTEFPAAGCAPGCRSLLTQAYADNLLTSHADAKAPANIYKPWVFPFRMIRAGWANVEGGPLFYAAYVNDLAKLPGLAKVIKVPLPGRLAFEVLVGSSEILVPQYAGFDLEDGLPVLVRTGTNVRWRGRRIYYGLQYENSVSNLFGYFVGLFNRYDHLGEPDKIIVGVSNFRGVRGALIAADTPRLTYQVAQLGLYFEHPKLRNFTVHAGPTFAFPSAESGVFVRVSATLWRTRGRVQFGEAAAP